VATAIVFLSGWDTHAQVVSLHTGDMLRVGIVLNNRVRVRALIDTGASTFVLCEVTAKALNLKRGAPVDLITPAGRIPGHYTTIAALHIGLIKLSDMRAVVQPDSEGCETLLGLSVLRKLRAVILANEVLTLVGHPPRSGRRKR